MNWTGKIVGLLLGLMSRRLWGIVLGLVLGHLYDMGLFSRRKQSEDAASGSGSASASASAPASGDHYATLGIGSEASDEELETAYRRRMSEYHPDRVANAAPEIREMAELRSREINQAYDQIKRQRGL